VKVMDFIQRLSRPPLRFKPVRGEVSKIFMKVLCHLYSKFGMVTISFTPAVWDKWMFSAVLRCNRDDLSAGSSCRVT
jgi:hypothetical protein